MKQAQNLSKLYQQRVDNALAEWLPAENINPHRLHEAMRYSTFNGGKRVRPILTYFTGQALGLADTALDGPACAVELIHAYSLVHDDLPAMDDDDLRRGKPTCHKAFDEATAVLVGDALQSLAFHVLAHDKNMVNNAQKRLEMIDTLAVASGSRGMAGGQAIDLYSENQALNIAELENMHIHKTGALIRASVKLGVLSHPEPQTEIMQRLDHYAKCIGLAFQIRDDIIDIESDTETLGKPQGSDLEQNKVTYPALLGMDGAKKMANDLYQQALESLDPLGEQGNNLRWLAEYIVQRDN